MKAIGIKNQQGFKRLAGSNTSLSSTYIEY